VSNNDHEAERDRIQAERTYRAAMQLHIATIGGLLLWAISLWWVTR